MNISTNKTCSIIFAPLIKICEYLGKYHPVFLVKLRYFGKFKKWPDLKNPKDLNEKYYAKVARCYKQYRKINRRTIMRDFLHMENKFRFRRLFGEIVWALDRCE